MTHGRFEGHARNVALINLHSRVHIYFEDNLEVVCFLSRARKKIPACPFIRTIVKGRPGTAVPKLVSKSSAFLLQGEVGTLWKVTTRNPPGQWGLVKSRETHSNNLIGHSRER